MYTKLSIIVASHLEDALIEMNIDDRVTKARAEFRIRFVKYLLFKFRDLNEEIDPDEQLKAFNDRNAKVPGRKG